jgi:hypothetical protein
MSTKGHKKRQVRVNYDLQTFDYRIHRARAIAPKIEDFVLGEGQLSLQISTVIDPLHLHTRPPPVGKK